MKNKTFFHSIACAASGLCKGIREEKNFKIYFINVIVAVLINILLKFSLVEFLIYGVAVAGVFSAECVNTAIERLCDFLTEEQNEKIKFVKDIAAGAVLCWGIFYYIAEIIMIGTNLLA